MSTLLRLKNNCRGARLDVNLLQRVFKAALELAAPKWEHDLQVTIVGDDEMTRLNETLVKHAGTTDVITLDYCPEPGEDLIAGELFLCLDEARRQAVAYGVPWQQELVRYGIHGILHLTGYDDVTAALRARMKREEDRLLREVEGRFALDRAVKTRAAGQGAKATRPKARR